MDRLSEFHYFHHEDDENENEDFSIENESKMLNELDPEVIEYLSEARIIKKTSRRKRVKKEKIKYKAGDTVLVDNKAGSIFYGPYDKNNKSYYEVEISGEIRSIEYDDIQLP